MIWYDGVTIYNTLLISYQGLMIYIVHCSHDIVPSSHDMVRRCHDIEYIILMVWYYGLMVYSALFR